MSSYIPPYPGAVQDELAWHLVKYLREDVVLLTEHEVEVPAGPGHGPAFFTLDFLAQVPMPDGSLHRVAIETHTTRTLRDHERRLRRDATLLASGLVDVVFRVRGTDVASRVDDVLHLVGLWEPALFSERGRVNLHTLASPQARATTVRPEQPSVLVGYPPPPDPDAPLDADAPSTPGLGDIANGAPHLLVRRLARAFPGVWLPYADTPNTRRAPGAPQP